MTMTSVVSEVHGRTVRAIDESATELSLSLSEGWGLSIYNPFLVLLPDSGLAPSAKLLGDIIEFAEMTEAALTFEFKSGNKLIVSLQPDDYSGPEAAVIAGPNGQFVVVN